MLLLDSIFRYANLTLTILLLLMLVRAGGRSVQTILIMALLFTSIGDVIVTAPAQMLYPYPVFVTALFVAIPTASLEWLAMRALIEDNFKIGWLEVSVVLVACTFKFGWVLHGLGIYPPLHAFRYWMSYAIGLSMGAHILWLAVAGFKDDLVQQRRQVRIWLLVVISLVAIAGTATELIGFSSSMEATIRNIMTVPILVWIIMWLNTLNVEQLLSAATDSNDRKNSNIAPKDVAIHERLINVMEQEAAYSDHGLSIRALSERIGVPEHRLRILINQTMGYRNFPSFVNNYRIAYAKQVLADLEMARLPILSIAMDAGFQTLSTFNRAFKAAEGETPSVFRERALSQKTTDTGK